jgi:uncharacterized protein (TIGR02217 family)
MALDLFPGLIGQGFLSEKTALWSTAIAEATSGRERRRRLWSYPRWRFKLNYEVLRDVSGGRDLLTLFTFFNAHAGRSVEFGFLDATDNAVTSQYFGTGDGSATMFQLLRTANSGGFVFTEPVRAVYGTPKIYFDGAIQSAGSYAIDDYGVVTFTIAPPAGVSITWTGQYLFHVRFDQDELSPAQMMQTLWSLSGLQMVTVKR